MICLLLFPKGWDGKVGEGVLLCPASSLVFLPWVQIGSWLCHKAQREPTIPEVTQQVMPAVFN